MWIISQAMMKAYENSRCLQAQAEEFLAANCLDGEPSAQSNLNPTPQAYLSSDKTTGFLRLSRFGMTFGHLTADRGADLLTWYRADFPARTYPWQGKALASQASGQDFGPKWLGSLAKFDPDSRSWKTAQLSLLGGSELSSVTWPRSGMTANGECWERPIAVRSTDANESGLLPTPTACDHKGSGRLRLGRGANNNLRDWFKINYGFLYPPVRVVEWLMGWPEEWGDLRPQGTDKFQSWLQQHGRS